MAQVTLIRNYIDNDCIHWRMRSNPSTSLTISRSRYTEGAPEEAVKHGVQQNVILGAGMDTFAFRRPDMLEQLKIFELDHPDTQTFKRHRLTELGWEPPANLHFVPVVILGFAYYIF